MLIPYFQFHFATVLSPWIRRALIAAGFGIGETWSNAPREIAPVVVLHDDDTDNQQEDHFRQTDLEASRKEKAKDSRSPSLASEEDGGHTTLIPSNTPFFHYDLTAAVRAAESGLQHSSKRRSSLGGGSQSKVDEV